MKYLRVGTLERKEVYTTHNLRVQELSGSIYLISDAGAPGYIIDGEWHCGGRLRETERERGEREGERVK
jgi:hypothetical protein